MQAVILAAGRGTRMGALTRSLPKPLLQVSGKTLLEHKFDVLPESVDEIIIVVGYLGDMIRQHFGGSYKGKKLSYVEQGPIQGTAGALWSARELLREKFVVMMSDDVYSRKDIERAERSDVWLIFGMEYLHTHGGGRIITERGTVADIIEGVNHDEPGIVCTNLFSLDSRLFQYKLVPKSPGSPEYGLPQTVLAASRESGIPLELVQTDAWIQINEPDDLQIAERILANSAV